MLQLLYCKLASCVRWLCSNLLYSTLVHSVSVIKIMTLYLTRSLSSSTQSILLLSLIQFTFTIFLIVLVQHKVFFFVLDWVDKIMLITFCSIFFSQKNICAHSVLFSILLFVEVYHSLCTKRDFLLYLFCPWFAKISHKLSHLPSLIFFHFNLVLSTLFHFDQMRLPTVVMGIRIFLHRTMVSSFFVIVYFTLCFPFFFICFTFNVRFIAFENRKFDREKVFLSFISLMLSCYFNVCDLLRCLPCFFDFAWLFFINLDKQKNVFCDFRLSYLDSFLYRKKSIQYISFVVSSLFVIDL